MSKQKQFMYTTCSELVIFMHWTRNSMNNLLSYFGSVDGRIRASDKDLPLRPSKIEIVLHIATTCYIHTYTAHNSYT